MSKFATIESRLRELEHSGSYLTLPDGSRFQPGRAIDLCISFFKLIHEVCDPKLSDFPPETQVEWKCFAKWNPDIEVYGGISRAVVELARRLVEGSDAR